MTLAYGWDSAFIPDPVPTDIGGLKQSYALIYLGGSSAFRVTPQAERERICAAGLLTMPCWVPTPGFDNPRQAGLAAADAMRAAGIPAGARPWRVLMWDLETGIEPDPAWLTIAANTLESRAYGSLVYGSVDGSGLFSYPPRTGYMVARYDGRPVLYPHADVVGKQYQAGVAVPGGVVDLNVVDPALLAHLGRVS